MGCGMQARVWGLGFRLECEAYLSVRFRGVGLRDPEP